MNGRMVRMLSLFGLAVFLATSTNMAQSAPLVTVEIPFAFNAGAAHFEAGTYMVDDYAYGRGILELKELNGSGTAFVMGSHFENNPKPDGKSKLIFNKYADQYFLSQVWMENGALGCTLAPSKKEKEVMHSVAANKTAREVVQIATR